MANYRLLANYVIMLTIRVIIIRWLLKINLLNIVKLVPNPCISNNLLLKLTSKWK